MEWWCQEKGLKLTYAFLFGPHKPWFFFLSKRMRILLCNMKCCSLKWMHKNIPRQDPCLAFRLSSPNPHTWHLSLSLGVLTEWFLPRLWRGGGCSSLLRHTPWGSGLHPSATVPGINHSWEPLRCLLRNERQERQQATGVTAGIGNKKKETVCFHFKCWHRKERKDYISYFFLK